MSKAKFKPGDEITFIVMDVIDPPTNHGTNFCIAFVPKEGFQWCKYYNGSKSWKSNISGQTVNPTQWLKHKDEPE